MVDYKRVIGNNIKMLRKKKGFTQEQLATELNMSTMTIRRYEAGVRVPNWTTLQEMAEIFDVSPHQIASLEIEVERMKDSIFRDFGRKDSVLTKAIHLYESVQKDDNLVCIHTAYEKLNETGKKVAVERVEELADIPKYTEKK